jgi:hypothetical protein
MIWPSCARILGMFGSRILPAVTTGVSNPASLIALRTPLPGRHAFRRPQYQAHR